MKLLVLIQIKGQIQDFYTLFVYFVDVCLGSLITSCCSVLLTQLISSFLSEMCLFLLSFEQK